MGFLTELSWKMYPSLFIIAIGLAILIKGTSMAYRSFNSPMSDPTKIHRFVIGLRIAVIGITMAGLGVAWNWDILWLFVLSLAFGGVEIVESTVHLHMLRSGSSRPATA